MRGNLLSPQVEIRKVLLNFIILSFIFLLTVFVVENFVRVNIVLAQNPPPDFSLREARSGEIVHLYNYSNKIILLNFMTTWCPWDSKEFDYVLVPLYESYYKNDSHVVFISIHLDPDKGPEISSYIKEHNVNWLVLEGGKWSSSKVAEDYGVDAVPRTFILKFFGTSKEIIYQKRGHDPENFYKFHEVIENAKREIIEGLLKNHSEQSEITRVFSYLSTIQLYNGKSITLNYSTTSEVVIELIHDSKNNVLHIRVDERNEAGFFTVLLSKEFLKEQNSSIEEIVITINGKECERTYIKNEGNVYLIRVEYGRGEKDIQIFYQSSSLTVYAQSIFGLPVSNAVAILEWPNGQIFKEQTLSSSGKTTFQRVPSINAPYTIYIEYGLLSFQFIPQEIFVNKDSEIVFTSYIYYDTFFTFLSFFIISIIMVNFKKRRRTHLENNSSREKNKEDENYARL